MQQSCCIAKTLPSQPSHLVPNFQDLYHAYLCFALQLHRIILMLLPPPAAPFCLVKNV